jgi:formate hydrogenlyase transcriptional activator
LASYLLTRFASQLGRRFEGIGQATMERLVNYNWPGNIRELANVMERSVILCTQPWLTIEPHVLLGTSHIKVEPNGADEPTAQPVPDQSPITGVATDSLESIEKSHILHVLEKTNWRIEGDAGAAQILGLHPNTLRSRMKKLGLSRNQLNGGSKRQGN